MGAALRAMEGPLGGGQAAPGREAGGETGRHSPLSTPAGTTPGRDCRVANSEGSPGPLLTDIQTFLLLLTFHQIIKSS